MPGTTRFVALKATEFESRYLSLPLPNAAITDPNSHRLLCREMLGSCMQKCGLSNWMSATRFNLGIRFDNGRGVDPDIERMNAGCYILGSLFPGNDVALPWWMTGSLGTSDSAMLSSPDSLRMAVDRLHELKLLEVILANVSFGEAAPHIISFCRFLEDNVDRNAWLLAVDSEE